ncbi:hypothetical protein ACFUJU_20950 [Streptomyces sp. NPDC057235]|uniref:hypothetical protein n=1 Tax=Streptomyces sp. NPDC057235 TaxID=3346058 RepID=UPI0036335866
MSSTNFAGLNVIICCRMAQFSAARSVRRMLWIVAGPVTLRNGGISASLTFSAAIRSRSAGSGRPRVVALQRAICSRRAVFSAATTSA